MRILKRTFHAFLGVSLREISFAIFLCEVNCSLFEGVKRGLWYVDCSEHQSVGLEKYLEKYLRTIWKIS